MKVKIDKHKLTSNELKIFNNVKKVYIPLISGDDTDITILVKKGEYVYKGSIIGKRKGNFRIPIFSTVSGKVIDFENKIIYNGEKIKCIVIENDFKEKINDKIVVKQSINKYTKKEFLNKLMENGVIGLGGRGFPTYIKYDNSNIDTLIVNAIESEPYVTCDEYIAKEKCEEILETIDAILEINNIAKAIIAIKKNSPLKEIFENFIGTYLKIKIKLVTDDYSIGYERILIKKLLNVEYKDYPIEKGIVVNNISTIYSIYEALKYNKPLIERVITFSGEGLKNKQNVLVKFGTPVKDILKDLQINDNPVLVAGGPITGKQVDDLIITSNLNAVLLMPLKKEIVNDCINCGKCNEVCPMHLCPSLIMNLKNNVSLKKLHFEKCIECGLCSYICPSKINVREKVIDKKNDINNLRGDK